MKISIVLYGIALWAVGTIALRLGGQGLLEPGHSTRILFVFLISFPLMAWISRRICRRFGLAREQWVEGAVALALPTLLLDAFASAFFGVVYPNMAPEAAGIFGGWMLWCCAGVFVGALVGRPALRG